jgi:hypothetical protein
MMSIDAHPNTSCNEALRFVAGESVHQFPMSAMSRDDGDLGDFFTSARSQ